jgi:hypothetical protein
MDPNPSWSPKNRDRWEDSAAEKTIFIHYCQTTLEEIPSKVVLNLYSKQREEWMAY